MWIHSETLHSKQNQLHATLKIIIAIASPLRGHGSKYNSHKQTHARRKSRHATQYTQRAHTHAHPRITPYNLWHHPEAEAPAPPTTYKSRPPRAMLVNVHIHVYVSFVFVSLWFSPCDHGWEGPRVVVVVVVVVVVEYYYYLIIIIVLYPPTPPFFVFGRNYNFSIRR